MSHFTVTARSAHGSARAGALWTPHGVVPTPCFMPIATFGAVRHVAPRELHEVGAAMILANTYHLALRPGSSAIAARGGLHAFMGWDGPILTDSGGFQVFSLGARAKRRGKTSRVHLSEAGVAFQSHLDGSTNLFTPERIIDEQRMLGIDVAMVLDVCPPQPCPDDELAAAVTMTTRWAERSLHHAARCHAQERMQVFGIVQGGSNEALRAASVRAITALPFDGFAIGGVAVGEDVETIRSVVARTAPLLPEDRPRYLMGLGRPDDIAHAVWQGIDLFDCVLPTREARHGRVYRWLDRAASMRAWREGSPLVPQTWYAVLNVTQSRYRTVDTPLDPMCRCPACAHHSIAYLRHCLAIGEPLGQRLLTLHNLTFYLDVMQAIREALE